MNHKRKLAAGVLALFGLVVTVLILCAKNGAVQPKENKTTVPGIAQRYAGGGVFVGIGPSEDAAGNIVFAGKVSEGARIFIRNDDTGIITGLSPLSGWCCCPSISRSGRYVAFVSGNQKGYSELHVADRQSGTITILPGIHIADANFEPLSPIQASPTEDVFAFTALTDTGRRVVYRYRPANDTLDIVSPTNADCGFPVWSGVDGNLFFTRHSIANAVEQWSAFRLIAGKKNAESLFSDKHFFQVIGSTADEGG